MSEFVGSYINPEVSKQLQVRSAIHGKKTRSIEDLQYLNSRTSWVRVISSVNTDVEFITTGRTELGDTPEPSKGTPNLAKKYILSGPISYTGTDTFTQKTGIDYTGNSNKLYNYNSSTGFRPSPGITGFRVTSKNRFGSIREATIDFKVWSKEDIDNIEQLYFRPGYSAVIEWGHSIYVDNDGKLQTSPSFNVGTDTYFTEIPFSKIVEKTTENKKTHSGNYDAFIGYIKNFSWSFTNDGGYDCSVNVISFGEILESLTVRTPPTIIKARLNEEEAPKEEIKSVIHLLFSELITRISSNETATRDKIKTTVSESILQREIDRYVDVRNYPIAFRVANFDTQKPFYIPLKILLTLLNSLMIKYGECSSEESLVKFAINEKENGKYLTFDDHFSLDPKVCILPKVPISDTFKDCKLPNHPTLSNVQFLFETFNRYSNLEENCLTILLHQRMLEETLDNYLRVDGDSYQFSVLDYIRDVLGQVNSALGNINEIDVEYDEELRKYKIIDRKRNIPEDTEVEPQPLTLTGPSSIFSALSAQSKISNKLGSMISIAAQGSNPRRDSKTLEDTSLWIAYNAGLVDRFAPEKVLNGNECYKMPDEQKTAKRGFWKKIKEVFISQYPYVYGLGVILSTPKQEEVATFVEIAEKAYLEFKVSTTVNEKTGNVTFSGGSGKYEPDLFDKLKTLGPPFFADILNIQNLNKDSNYAIKGIIPVELSFTTDGIGGLKIGQSFTVNGDLLPTKFNNYGYIITGLEHSIEGNKWLTQVKAQTYLLPGDNQTSSTSQVTSPTGSTTSTTTSAKQECLDEVKSLRKVSKFSNISRISTYSNTERYYTTTTFTPGSPISLLTVLGKQAGFQYNYANTTLGFVKNNTLIVDKILAELLYEINQKVGTKLIITSGYRTPEQNNKLNNSAINSYHLSGMAYDLVPPAGSGVSLCDVAQAASKLGAGGVFLYDRHVHVDIGEFKTPAVGRY